LAECQVLKDEIAARTPKKDPEKPAKEPSSATISKTGRIVSD